MVTTARSTRVGAVVLAALALSACTQQACTTIGCESSVRIDVGAVRGLGATEPGRVMVCVGTSTDCALAEAVKGQHVVTVVLPEGAVPESGIQADGTVVVRVKIMNPGQVLLEKSVTTTFTKLAPNGESCGPVCYTTSLVADDRGVTSLPVEASPTMSG